jgi:hypothetical protein
LRELVFIIDQVEDNQFIAHCVDEAIFTEGDDFQSLQDNIIEAVETHLDPNYLPVKVRYQFRRVRTLSIIGYLAAIYAWMLEACVVLLHLFAKIEFGAIGHIALLLTSISLSAFAWRRREDFRALRASRGNIPLTRYQLLAILTFLLALICLLTGIGALIVGK